MLSRQSNYSFGTKIYIVLYAPYVSMLLICMYCIEIEGEEICWQSALRSLLPLY